MTPKFRRSGAVTFLERAKHILRRIYIDLPNTPDKFCKMMHFAWSNNSIKLQDKTKGNRLQLLLILKRQVAHNVTALCLWMQKLESFTKISNDHTKWLKRRNIKSSVDPVTQFANLRSKRSMELMQWAKSKEKKN